MATWGSVVAKGQSWSMLPAAFPKRSGAEFMHPRYWLLPLIAVCAATAYWRVTFDIKLISVALKCAPALLMALHVGLHEPRRGAAMIAALVLHAMGDACLDLGKRYLLLGIGVFFLGHFGYLASFWPHRRQWRELPLALKWLIVGVVLAMAGLNVAIWPRMPGVLAIAAPVYALALTTMTTTALMGRWSGPLVALGALLFLFSDVLIGLRMFLDERRLAFLIWPTYVAAQLLIPLGWLAVHQREDNAGDGD